MIHQNIRRFLETPTNLLPILKPVFRLNLMSIWALGLVLVGSSLLLGVSSTKSMATSTLLGDPAEKVAALETLVKPQIQQAVDWSMTVGLGLVSSSAFYALVVRLIKL